MLSKIIRNFVAKMVAGRTDDGIMITLPDPKKVDFQTAMVEDLLMRNGIDPQLIKTEDELKNIINQIEAVNKQKLQQAESGIRNTESAKVFDLEGQQIPPESRIMGGKAVETEAEIAARLEKENKDSVQKILDRKNREDVYGLEDYDTTNMSDLKKELIRTETKLGNLNPDSPNFRERAKPLIDKIEAIQKKMKGGETSSSTLDQQIKNEYDKAVKEGKFKGTEEDFRNKIDDAMDEDFATGGRVGLKAGMSRRAFLALMGSAGAGIGAAKTGLLKLFGKGAGKQVTKEIIKTPPVPGKPEWFDNLVNKVILEGDDVTKKLSIQDRQVVHSLKIDDMDDVTVYRNLDDGQIRVSYDSPNNMGEQPVELVFKPGMADEVTKGKPADEFYAVEAEPRGVRTGPDDFDIEFDGENLASNVDELISDTSKLKQIARGDKKPTLKEFVESKKKKDQTRTLNEDQLEQAEYLETKYGPGPEGPEEFASGGIARMLGE